MGKYDDLFNVSKESRGGGKYEDIAPGSRPPSAPDLLMQARETHKQQEAAKVAAKEADLARRGIMPLQPNDFRINWGFDKYTDVPLPEWTRPYAGYVDSANSAIAPVARGAAAVPGIAADAAKWAYQKATGQPTSFGSVTKGIQDTLNIDERDPKAGFGTDVLEAMGGGVAGRAIQGGRAIANTIKGTVMREAPVAVGSTLGSYAGEALAEQIFGKDSPNAKLAGSVLGGFTGGAVPSAASALAAKPAARLAFGLKGPLDDQGRTQSRAAYDANIDAGINPMPAMIGNETIGRLSNTIAKVPIIGTGMQDRFNQAYRDFQQKAYDAAFRVADRAPQTPVPPHMQRPPSENVVGAQMRHAAREGEQNLDAQTQRAYGDFYRDQPETILVEPRATDAVVARQANPYHGEGGAGDPVRGWYRDNVQGATIGGQGPATPGMPLPAIPDRPLPREPGMPQSTVYPNGPQSQGPATPGTPMNQGLPLQQAGDAVTRTYTKDGMPQTSGALTQGRQAMKSDIDDALMNDREAIAHRPDPADRAAEVERLRVLHTERAMQEAKDVSRGGNEVKQDGRAYVGGDKPALKSIMEAKSDESAFNIGSVPDNMAVLQRTMPPRGTSANLGGTGYGDLAASNILLNSKSGVPNADINISPEAFTSWWQNLDPNTRMILTNEGFDPRRSVPVNAPPRGPVATPRMNEFDTLAEVGTGFQRVAKTGNPSGSGNTAGALALLAALQHAPYETGKTAAMSIVGSKILRSDALARAIAGVGPAKFEEILSGLYEAAGSNAALQNNESKRPLTRVYINGDSRRPENP